MCATRLARTVRYQTRVKHASEGWQMRGVGSGELESGVQAAGCDETGDSIHTQTTCSSLPCRLLWNLLNPCVRLVGCPGQCDVGAAEGYSYRLFRLDV